MSSAARPDPAEAPEERRFLRSARDGDTKDRGRVATRRGVHHGQGMAGRGSHGQDGSEAGGMARMGPGGFRGPPRILLESLQPAAANAS